MSFEDIASVLGQAFGMELKVVQDTTVFEVVSDDGSTKVQILLQDSGERNLVLMSADLGEVPPRTTDPPSICRANPPKIRWTKGRCMDWGIFTSCKCNLLRCRV